MKINLLTLFPSYFDSSLKESMLKKAQEKNLVEFNVINIRDFTTDKHQVTDDRPFGGGAGMVMKVEPIYNALKHHQIEKDQKNKRVILTSAKGDLFNQNQATSLSKLEEITIICGHYEGVDERVATHLVDQEIRIGDYILTGGEPASMVMTDAVTRLIPGVLGNEQSKEGESHSSPGQFSYPQYTRPESFNNWDVPSILLSGDHAKVEQWREDNRSK